MDKRAASSHFRASRSPHGTNSHPQELMEAKPRRRTRERILELSLKLFNEIGEPNVTTTTIAEEMQISPGNLYYHFRNKDDIINSIFAQFEGEIERRMQFLEQKRPTIDEVWLYLQQMSDFLWTYRFFYRDLNDLLARNRTLELHFKQIIGHKVRFARDLCEHLVKDGEMAASAAEISVISTNMGLIATYWLSYQFVMNPRKYNDQEAIGHELHQASQQILSIIAPYLRGHSRKMFDDLVSGKTTLPPLTDTNRGGTSLPGIHASAPAVLSPGAGAPQVSSIFPSVSEKSS
jgi:AcrR family transcriptional regulator